MRFIHHNILWLFALLASSLLQVRPPCGGGPPVIGLPFSLIPLQPQPRGAEEAGHPPHLAGEGASAAAAREGQVNTPSCLNIDILTLSNYF